MDLDPLHQAQAQNFIKFFKKKREACILDRQAVREDFLSDHTPDPDKIWNNGEVEELLQKYSAQADAAVAEALDKVNTLAAVYCTELMRAAQAQGMILQTEDIALVEDQNRQDHVAHLSAAHRAPLPAPQRQTLLPTLGSPSGAASDPAMIQQVQDARQEAAVATERFQAIQVQVTELLQERSTLHTQLGNEQQQTHMLRHQLSASQDPNSQHLACEMQMTLEHTQAALAQKTSELDAINAHLANSSQFQQLKGMVKEKNNTIKTLRATIQQLGYSPPGEDVGNADSD